MADNSGRSGSVFERNPKKTVTIVILAVLVITTLGVEKYLGRATKGNSLSQPGVSRHIRLREHPPHKVSVFTHPIDRPAPDDPPEHLYRLGIDGNGFIVPSEVHADPDMSVVFLGGSTTQCTYVGEEKRFPYLVGRYLEREGRTVNSYNSGVSGNHSLHSIDILINKVVPMSPDIVVMMHNINDLGILMYEDTYWNDNWSRSLIVTLPPPPPLSLRRLVRDTKNYLIPNIYARFSQLVRRGGGSESSGDPLDEFAHLRGTRVDIDADLLAGKFRRNLNMFISICEAADITPVLMTQANRFKEEPDESTKQFMSRLQADFGIEYDDYRAAYRLFNDTIRGVGAANDVLVIDLEASVPQERAYMYDGIHFSEKGCEFVARLIAEKLE